MSDEAVIERATTLKREREIPAGGPLRRWPFSPWHLFLLPLALVMLTPLVWMLITSVETNTEARRFPPVLIPESIHLQNYSNAWNSSLFARFFVNTLVVTLVVVAANLLLCSLAGYAFARIRFLGREVLFFAMLATLMIPFQVVLIPTFLIVKQLGLVNTLGALIVPNLVTPFGIFLLRQFFRTVPVELEEAARIDGASRLGVLFKIVLPLSAPALATLGVIIFLWTWNDFLWPLVVLYSEENFTLQLGLLGFQGAHSIQWPLLMAGNVIAMVPMLIVFFLAQRWFVRSVAMSGLKG